MQGVCGLHCPIVWVERVGGGVEGGVGRETTAKQCTVTMAGPSDGDISLEQTDDEDEGSKWRQAEHLNVMKDNNDEMEFRQGF